MLKTKPKKAWLYIFIKPKVTIRKIVEFDPNYGLLFLSWIFGFALLSSNLIFFINKINSLLLITLITITSPLIGYLLFSMFSWFLFKTGKWLKGKGSFKEIRAAYAWSNITQIIYCSIIIIFISLLTTNFFLEDTNKLTNLCPTVFFIIISLIFIIIYTWTSLILFISLAEVQKFSILRAILNLFLAIITMTIIIICLSGIMLFLIMLLISSFFKIFS